MKKRYLAIVLAIMMVMLTVLAGCGNSAQGGGSSAATPPADSGSAPAAAPTATGGPNALGDGSTDLENVAFFDPDFDYTSNGPYKLKYLISSVGPLYDDVDKAIQHWAPLFNFQYDGMFASNEDNDLYLNQLQTCIDQGYDALIIDPDTTIYPAILEILNAHPEVQWMADLAPPRDESSAEAYLEHPYVGHEHYEVGKAMGDKLIEYKEENWPEVPWEEVGVLTVTYSIVPPLDARPRGVKDQFIAKFPEYADNVFTVDCTSGGMDPDTARNLVQPLVSTNSQYTHWLIGAAMDDFAIGASSAIDSLGLTDVTCIDTMGGSGLIRIFDSGLDDSWRYANYTAQTVYVEPIMGALYAFISGYATLDTLWPNWINKSDHGSEGHMYASYQLPQVWLDKDNYKAYLAWSDVYAQSNYFPEYPKDGITRDSFSTRQPKPAYYDE
ncbi:MAG: hypothetical protein LBS91_02170 [Clostridiales Family XIII bacterium]|nr:hypothetical protein [Clostridiales Family XIII bacterium]